MLLNVNKNIFLECKLSCWMWINIFVNDKYADLTIAWSVDRFHRTFLLAWIHPFWLSEQFSNGKLCYASYCWVLRYGEKRFWLCDVLLADRLFFEFLRSLSPGGECLIELKHWRFCLVSEIEFLGEFSRLTWTMHWTLRSILSTSLKPVGQTRLSFCRMSVAFGMGQKLFFFHFCMEERFFLKDD